MGTADGEWTVTKIAPIIGGINCRQTGKPSVPNCKQLGMNPGVDHSCAKKVSIGKSSPIKCKSDLEDEGALCYPRCRPGYHGVGPVCWASNPSGWIDCGMGSARDSGTCAQIIMDQVSSIGTMTLNLVRLAGSGGKLSQLR